MADASVDSIVTDPPYGLSFMGKRWDYDVPSEEIWRECLRVLRPGGHLLAFAGTRTQHRMAVRIEDAGFEIRDMIAWVYGSGFPKSLDVSKAIDKAAGAEREVVGRKTGRASTPVSDMRGGRMHAGGTQPGMFDASAITAPATEAAHQWQGWGTALKPALEPITVARKPLGEKTVAANVLAHGTGGINVDGCRVGNETRTYQGSGAQPHKLNAHGAGDTGIGYMDGSGRDMEFTATGRWPANLIHDGSDEVVGLFPTGAKPKPERRGKKGGSGFGLFNDEKTAETLGVWPADEGGSSARFFYCAKASKNDRDEGCEGMEEKTKKVSVIQTVGVGLHGQSIDGKQISTAKNNHPTVKPTALMRYLCRLVTPRGGKVLDPFMGSGSTGKAAVLEGFNFIGIEREAEYVQIAKARIAAPEASTELPLFAA
jgi:site-specific DNA-methyltransferase (adenine-specific)